MTKFTSIFSAILFAIFVLVSCGESSSSEAGTTETETTQDKPVEAVIEEETSTSDDAPSLVMLGTWTGEMNNKKLTIVLDKIEGKAVSGHNTLGDNKRDLKGTFEEGAWDQPCAKAFETILNEPGDDEWDGVFTIKFVGYEDEIEVDGDLDCGGKLEGAEAMGQWKSNNGKSQKSFSLEKQ